MFNDDFWEDEFDTPIENLLECYDSIKQGTPLRFLDEEEYEFIIEYFYQNNREADALEACEIAGTYFPYSSEILLLKAELLFQGQKFGQALQSLDLLDSYDQNLLESALLRSDIYLAQFKFDKAAQFLEDRINHFEGIEKIELLLELSDVYDECDDHKGVFETLKRILVIDPRTDEALHKICFWTDFAGLYEESIELHQSIIEEDPYNAPAWFNLGTAYQGMKLYEKAIDAYEYCVAIDEKFEFAYRNMADAYMRLRWYEKAIESLEKNLELGKPEDVIYEAMGHCFEKKKDFNRARYFYRQAIQLNPADDSIFYRIGETYTREQQWEKAIKAYSVALHLNKDNASYSIAIGNCLMEMNAGKEALVCYMNAVKLKPNNKTTWTALIKGLYLNNHFEEAISQILLAKENIGNKPDFEYYHAAALFALGKSKEALIHLENGLSEAPQRLKLLTELSPEVLQRKAVSDLMARNRRKK